MMYAIINGNEIKCLYVEPKEGTVQVEMPENWRNHKLSYENGQVVLGEPINNEPIQLA